MLPYENSRQQYLYQPSFDPETSSVESYPPTTMDGYSYTNTTAYNNTLPFAFCPYPDTQETDAYNFEMARTGSNASMKRQMDGYPPALLSSTSHGSPSSSTVGSPYSGHAAMMPMHDTYLSHDHMSGAPAIFCDDHIHDDFTSGHGLLMSELNSKGPFASVDPNLLSGSRDSIYNHTQYSSANGSFAPSYSHYSNSSAPSPNPSHSGSGYSQNVNIDNYSNLQIRMERGVSESSHRSGGSPRSSVSDDDGSDKTRCPYEDCGRRGIKDMKAHMTTHLSERPEKCPIVNCPFYTKGFSRKYDRNRHTLTHYKGTMVCGFCPGSGSSAEKSFNRADVFKRHLTTIHKVEQNPPNSRKRSPGSSTKKLSSYCEDATGKCSTCTQTFDNAQDFYEHLDDCVLRVVQQLDPREAINARLLAEVASDAAVQETFDRNMIKQEDTQSYDFENDGDDMEDDDEEDVSRGPRGVKSSSRAIIGGNISKTKSGRKPNMTWSKIGVSLVGKGRRKRKHYPVDWGMSADKMKMKKRGIYVFEGPRRLLKDDMMLNNELEVRVKLADGSYITDLDQQTMKRVEAYHNATEEEKGPWEEEQPWIAEQDFITDLMS